MRPFAGRRIPDICSLPSQQVLLLGREAPVGNLSEQSDARPHAVLGLVANRCEAQDRRQAVDVPGRG